MTSSQNHPSIVIQLPWLTESRKTLCPLLRDAFGEDIACDSTSESFTQPPILAERFSMSASSEFYANAPSVLPLISYIQAKLCPSSSATCKEAAASLSSATYIDVDYDSISHAVIFNAFWAQSPDAASWTETISLPGAEETIEIGILSTEPNPDPDIIGFSGFLTVLGQDDKPSMLQCSLKIDPCLLLLSFTKLTRTQNLPASRLPAAIMHYRSRTLRHSRHHLAIPQAYIQHSS